AAALLLAVLLPAAPASAITNGAADGQDHPNVGGLVSPTQYSDGTWIYCSGTLISPTVFLTAAHCGEDGERVEVTFDTSYPGGHAYLYDDVRNQATGTLNAVNPAWLRISMNAATGNGGGCYGDSGGANF